MNKPEIGTFWVGGGLGWIEILAMRSWLEQGHDVTLFSYSPLQYVPEGVTWRDAREIFNTEHIFVHSRTRTPSCHSDIFRMKMLRDSNMIWMDLDFILLKSFALEKEFFFAPEKESNPDAIGNSVLKLPSNSQTLKNSLCMFEDIISGNHSYDTEVLFDRSSSGAFQTGLPAMAVDMYIADFGPVLLSKSLKDTGEIAHASPYSTVFPIDIKDTKFLLERSYDSVIKDLPPETFGVHLWATRFKNYLGKLSVFRNTEQLLKSFIIHLAQEHRVNFLSLPALNPSDRISDLDSPSERNMIMSTPSPKLSARLKSKITAA